MSRPFDPVALIEEGYVSRKNPGAWMRAMAVAITDNVDVDCIGVQFFRAGGAAFRR